LIGTPHEFMFIYFLAKLGSPLPRSSFFAHYNVIDTFGRRDVTILVLVL